jgi:hypothetical protein
MFGFGDDKALAGPTQVVRVNKKESPGNAPGPPNFRKRAQLPAA